MASQEVPPGGDKNTGPVQEAVYGLFLSISCVLVTLRFYVRARMVKNLWWDDFFLLLGFLFSIAAFGLSIASIHSGFGRHLDYLSLKQAVFALEMQAISLPFFITSLMFTKISVCLLLIRMFMTNRVRNYRVWKRAIYIVMALLVATNLSSIILIFPQCKPVAKLWNPIIGGTCWSRKTQIALYYYQGGVSIFTDFLLALLPIYFLKDIRISFRTKLSICALMSLGVFTGICAINRTALSTETYSSDTTYSSTMLNIWAALEVTVATIATAIPALRPLWAKSANQNRKNGEPVPPSNDKQPLNSTNVMMEQQMEADSLHSRLETRITAQGDQNHGDAGNEAMSPPDCNGIMKTSHISTINFRKSEGGNNWIPEHLNRSDRKGRSEAVV